MCGGVEGELWRRVAGGVHCEGDQSHIRHLPCRFLYLMHLRRHAGTRTGAGREEEIRDPDFTLEDGAVEWLAVLRRKLEARDGAIVGKYRCVGPAGEAREQQSG